MDYIFIIIKPFLCLYSKWQCNVQLAMQCSISSFNLKMQIGLHFHFQRRHALFKSILKSKCNYVVCNFIFRKPLWIELLIAIVDCIIIIMEGYLCLYSKWQCNVQLTMQCSISLSNMKMLIDCIFIFNLYVHYSSQY